MTRQTDIRRFGLAALTTGLVFCGCGQQMPTAPGVVQKAAKEVAPAEDEDTDPDAPHGTWVKYDDQGRVRAIGRPAVRDSQKVPSPLTHNPNSKDDEKR